MTITKRPIILLLERKQSISITQRKNTPSQQHMPKKEKKDFHVNNFSRGKNAIVYITTHLLPSTFLVNLPSCLGAVQFVLQQQKFRRRMLRNIAYPFSKALGGGSSIHSCHEKPIPLFLLHLVTCPLPENAKCIVRSTACTIQYRIGRTKRTAF